ncbi:uncharacterized protein [Euwallacea similis]|uniref:uncharacterized protein n=1 Tax=Euwallacea similis TaxID=1736056 RepID=UPI00344D6539
MQTFAMVKSKVLFTGLFLVFLFDDFGYLVSAAIPDYIKVCHRNDPKLPACIKESVEALRPVLQKGIPELDIPPIDPFRMQKVVIFDGVQIPNLKASMENLEVTGLGNFEISKVKLDVDKKIFRVAIKIPFLDMKGDYDFDSKLLGSQVKSVGNIHANVTDIEGQAVMQGSVDEKNRLQFDSIVCRFKVGDFNANMDNVLNEDLVLKQAVIQLLNNADKQQLVSMAAPYIEKRCSELLMKTSNKILQNFDYDELFPADMLSRDKCACSGVCRPFPPTPVASVRPFNGITEKLKTREIKNRQLIDRWTKERSWGSAFVSLFFYSFIVNKHFRLNMENISNNILTYTLKLFFDKKNVCLSKENSPSVNSTLYNVHQEYSSITKEITFFLLFLIFILTFCILETVHFCTKINWTFYRVILNIEQFDILNGKLSNRDRYSRNDIAKSCLSWIFRNNPRNWKNFRSPKGNIEMVSLTSYIYFSLRTLLRFYPLFINNLKSLYIIVNIIFKDLSFVHYAGCILHSVNKSNVTTSQLSKCWKCPPPTSWLHGNKSNGLKSGKRGGHSMVPFKKKGHSFEKYTLKKKEISNKEIIPHVLLVFRKNPFFSIIKTRQIKYYSIYHSKVKQTHVKLFIIRYKIFNGQTDRILASYIKVCRRNDPNLAQCIINSIQFLRPKLKEGIPELNVPSIEPLPLNEIKLRSGPNQAQINANITNLLVHGPSDFKIIDLKSDISKTRFVAQFTIPMLYFEGDYDIDMNILFLKYKGKGPIQGNFTNYVFNCLFKGDKIQRNNETYIQFRKFALKIFTGKSNLHLGNLFRDNGAVLSEATNALIRENTDVFIEEIKPALEDSLSDKFTNIANSITTRFSYDDLFPQ